VVDSSGYWWNLAIGDGNNDGVPELYSIFEYDLYQLKRVGISWQKSKVMRTNCTSNLFIGDGDGDGLNEVYCGDASGLGDVYVSRFKWDGSHWSVVNLGNAMYHDYSSDYMFVSAGDSHNDGSNEIYALLGGRVYEVTDQGKTWITSYGYFAIGDADNDGANEIYCAIASERTIYQLRWQ
jgi:hypothetical protein